jgi:plasmid stability protein
MHTSQNVSMTSITIRNVPDETRKILAARAARQGQSMQEFLRVLLEQTAAKADRNEVMDRVRHRVEVLGMGNDLGAEEIVSMIREDRGE